MAVAEGKARARRKNHDQRNLRAAPRLLSCGSCLPDGKTCTFRLSGPRLLHLSAQLDRTHSGTYGIAANAQLFGDFAVLCGAWVPTGTKRGLAIWSLGNRAIPEIVYLPRSRVRIRATPECRSACPGKSAQKAQSGPQPLVCGPKTIPRIVAPPYIAVVPPILAIHPPGCTNGFLAKRV
jgi:hypothetical protein